MRAVCVAAALVVWAAAACAQTVSMSGQLGDKALLVIDGTPRTVAAGSTVQGVKVLRVTSDSTLVEVGGKQVTLPLGGTQVSLGGSGGPAGGTRIVLPVGGGGHFFADGAINGKAVRFVVDTGATNVVLGEAHAQRLGIDYKRGQRGIAGTANGQVVAWRIPLDAVRVGDVTVYNVDATVVPAMGLEQVLLGNSFLSRFQMKRDNDMLVLDKRY